MSESIIVTGAAGFIGHAVSKRLLSDGFTVIGIDSLNAYYDPRLKLARLANLAANRNFQFQQSDVADAPRFAELVRAHRVKNMVHLAAQAGVRYSLENPFAYERSNVAGHLSVLEACRNAEGFEHLVYASSSSVYGDRPLNGRGFHEDDPCNRPVSLYAATKRSCELMSWSYARLFGMRQTGLRFFTVYGPWGRPDMAYYQFAERMMAGEPIEVFGNGAMARDFTYIDDIVEGVVGALHHIPQRGENRLLNIGGCRPVSLMAMIEALEAALGVTAKKILRPMQPGDVRVTCACVDRIQALTGYSPTVLLESGLRRFADWYLDYTRDDPLPSQIASAALESRVGVHERL